MIVKTCNQLILKNSLAPNLLERIELEVKLLVRCANAGISEQHGWFPLVVVVAQLVCAPTQRDRDKATTSATADWSGSVLPGCCRATARLGDRDLAFVLVLLIARGMGFKQGLKVGGREDMPLLEGFKQGHAQVFVCRVQQVN